MKNLLQTIIDTGNFKTLVKAVQEAGLVDDLSGDGPFTIFAPSDKAFSKLSKEILEDLLNDKEKLTEILTYHIILDKIMAKDIKKIKKAETANGKELLITIKNGVKINNVNIIKKDIKCSDGVIHIIDELLLPN